MIKKNIYFLILSLFFCACASAADVHYSIVVDAGSSGTRIHLFQYSTTQSIPEISSLFSEKMEPGFSSYFSNPDEVDNGLKKLLDDTTQAVKQKNVDPHNVPISIYGTGGMRALSQENQNIIYQHVQKIEQDYAFPLQEITTITGEMEGVYDWLDINYMKQTFQKNEPTVGAIDMGGASTQLVFATDSHTNDMIYINGQTYYLFVKSFMGLGQESARNSIDSNTLSTMCNIMGYLSGSNNLFDMTACGNAYTQLLESYRDQFQSIPFVAGQHFIAYSGVHYVYDFLEANLIPDRANLENRIQSVCHQNWTSLQNNYPKVNRKYLANYCAYAVYIDKLFYEEYQLKDSQFEVADSIQGQDIDWPLGKVLFDLVLQQNDVTNN